MYISGFRISFPAIPYYEIDHTESNNNKEEDRDANYEKESAVNRIY